MHSSGSRVLTGLDLICRREFDVLTGQRVGLLVHPASVDREIRHAADLLHAADQVDVCCLFGPQHGLFGQTQDNMIEWRGFREPVTGLPAYSLYGQVRKPTDEMLADIDTLVIDLQDVGARYYTFIWTMLLCLEACAANDKRVVVLDRPNPIGGVAREGTILQPDHHSFVGMAPIPMRHGLTIGELAVYFRDQRQLDLDLEIVWLDGWRREMYFQDTGLPWVMPSPNMPTIATALVYPGKCLLEGTELSEGRGTTRPFEIFGAPYLEPHTLVTRLQRWNLPGCHWRPLHFEPTFQKHAGTLCGGAQLHVTDPDRFNSVLATTAVLCAVNELRPTEFRWKQPPYEYETKKLPIDILAGGPQLRRAIAAGQSPHEIADSWQPGLKQFDDTIAGYLHYE